jgi:hypothetical protein
VLFTELGLNLAKLFELCIQTPRRNSDLIMFPRAFNVWCWCWGVDVPRHAKLVLSFVLLVLGVEAFSSWVIILLIGAIVIGAVGEVVVARRQDVPHGIRIMEPGKVQARIHVMFFLGVHTLRGWSGCEQV